MRRGGGGGDGLADRSDGNNGLTAALTLARLLLAVLLLLLLWAWLLLGAGAMAALVAGGPFGGDLLVRFGGRGSGGIPTRSLAAGLPAAALARLRLSAAPIQTNTRPMQCLF